MNNGKPKLKISVVIEEERKIRYFMSCKGIMLKKFQCYGNGMFIVLGVPKIWSSKPS